MAALTSARAAGKRLGMPLSFVIARYFVYSFVAVGITWVAAFMLLSSTINTGYVVEASWGPANARAVATELMDADSLGPTDIPTSYRYLIVDASGRTVATDLEGAQLDHAAEAADAARGAQSEDIAIEGGGGGLTFASFSVTRGGACVLVSEYLPQWASRDLAETLPNPQNIMFAIGIAGSALALALVAHRASRVISRKMRPLADAAVRIGQEELDFPVGRTNVREVNNILAAMDAMRSSLAESLDARWQAERAQREQMASLAHDLKTPLTVLRANADFVAEELECDEAPREGDRGDIAAAARDIAVSAERLDGYVRLLIEASHGVGSAAKAPVSPVELCRHVVLEAEPVARARGIELASSIQPDVAGAPDALLDRTMLARAVSNLVANAVEHARSRVEISCMLDGGSLVIEVGDDGAGFSPAALEHGCERLFTDDSSRGSTGGERHYGLGLFGAAEAARAHGGSVVLTNRVDSQGAVLGATATMRLPLSA
ncbi:HAMP domain-containing histidine kinase [Collinsella tanakaei]|nr:HAMP domain-containing histidine kinase [Collinsella tanakaei]